MGGTTKIRGDIMEEIREILNVLQHENFRTFVYSGDMNLITILFILMIIDIITGLGKAVKSKNLWSRKSLLGFARKIFVFLIITVANLLDLFMGLKGALVLATVTFYILNEVLSITENAGQLGIPLPEKLLEVIAVVQKKSVTDKKVDNIFYDGDDTNDKR